MSEIKPALTAEEWADELDDGLRCRVESACSEAGANDTLYVPALAALALQFAGPDGGPMFTWEDVERLRRQAKEEARGIVEGDPDRPRVMSEWLDLADRLAALLPPREP